MIEGINIMGATCTDILFLAKPSSLYYFNLFYEPQYTMFFFL